MGNSGKYGLFEKPSTVAHGTDEVGSTQVHAKETSEHSQSTHSYRSFLTSGILKKIASARNVYAQVGGDDGAKKLIQFDGCRSHAWFVRHKVSGMVRVASSRCGLRWCPICIKTRRMILTSAVGKWMDPIGRPKFLTLTLKHSDSPLSEQIDNLYGFFKELKRSKYFKKRVSGGVWFFQVKLSETDGRYHPHLHILLDSKFLDWNELKSIWERVTHGSKVVDVRAVGNKKKAVEYVARYASAPCELSDLPHHIALDVVKSLHGRRIVGTFGSAKGVKLTPSKPGDASDWEYMGDFFFYSMFRKTSERCRYVYEAWRDKKFCFEVPDGGEPPPELKSELMAEPPLTYKQLSFGF